MGGEITTRDLLCRVLCEGQMCEIKACQMVTNSRRYRVELVGNGSLRKNKRLSSLIFVFWPDLIFVQDFPLVLFIYLHKNGFSAPTMC